MGKKLLTGGVMQLPSDTSKNSTSPPPYLAKMNGPLSVSKYTPNCDRAGSRTLSPSVLLMPRPHNGQFSKKLKHSVQFLYRNHLFVRQVQEKS